MKKILITMLLVLATSVITNVQAQIFSNRSAQFKEGYAEVYISGNVTPSFRAKLATSLSAERGRECYQSMTKYN